MRWSSGSFTRTRTIGAPRRLSSSKMTSREPIREQEQHARGLSPSHETEREATDQGWGRFKFYGRRNSWTTPKLFSGAANVSPFLRLIGGGNGLGTPGHAES